MDTCFRSLRPLTLVSTVALNLVFGCSPSSGGQAPGRLRVLVESEDTITQGLEPGPDTENIGDGWTVTFDTYVVTLGDILLRSSRDPERRAAAKELVAVDLKRVGNQGETLWELEDLEPGRWEFHYALGEADERTRRHSSVSKEDFKQLTEDGLTYLIRGTLDKEGGQSCPPASAAEPGQRSSTTSNAAGDACYDNPRIEFEFAIQAATRFGPCEVDGLPGVSIPEGATATVAATIHGDHLFFNGFPTGSEGGTVRLAQLWADADLNFDGIIAREELEALRPSQMAEFDERYQLGGTPIPLDSLWAYARGQLKTQGHMDGEGGCPIQDDAPKAGTSAGATLTDAG